MGKNQKPKANAKKAKRLGLANETETRAKNSPMPSRRSKVTVAESQLNSDRELSV
jgi:hypothetical protein